MHVCVLRDICMVKDDYVYIQWMANGIHGVHGVNATVIQASVQRPGSALTPAQKMVEMTV